MSENLENITETASKVAEDVSKPSENISLISHAELSPHPEESASSISIEVKELNSTSIEQEEITSKPRESTEEAERCEEIISSPSCTDVANSTQVSIKTCAAEDVKDTKQLNDELSENSTRSPVTNLVTSSDADANYAEHVTYGSDGIAIYTDPKTNYRYKWCTIENNWLHCDTEKNQITIGSNADLYENDHYKWCSQTQKWIPKAQAQTTETEHYKWDAEKKRWIPKDLSAQTDTESNSASITYDIDEDGNRIYTDKDGTVFFWDSTKNAWFPKIDDDFMAHYQMNYGFIDNTSASEEEKRRKAEQEEKLKEFELQRMTEEAKASAEAATTATKRKMQEPPKWFDLDPERNTKVYVSNLPLDITMDEFAELMGKCGMIMRDPQTQKYKLKLYAELDGQLKGDGLCDYIKVESVGLALNILDEYNLRGHKIRVQRAEFQMRGEYNPALKPKRKKKDKDKLQKMKEKLFDWRPEKMRGERSKNEKVVIIKNLFDPSIFEKEVQLILDYQNDLRQECSKCGTVRKVVIYDRHPEGVGQVNMADPEEADVVIQMMHGRFFGQRKLSAEHWDGKTKYKVIESEAEVQKRLTHWDQYLTQGEHERKDQVSETKEPTTICTNEDDKDKLERELEESAISTISTDLGEKEE
ncbi:HIV Tat-specific factor 1 [Anastrepha obliqua]|uniref:HIV Tat-specific factor 1 n=1 Tax=Anastrepha obliqua TaxID=95512 RepID=UPI00240A8DDC|nr:HIV Tat-specific factor 1 [Anastrepha obliqua]